MSNPTLLTREEIAAELPEHRGMRERGGGGSYWCLTCREPHPCFVTRALAGNRAYHDLRERIEALARQFEHQGLADEGGAVRRVLFPPEEPTE